MSRFLCIQVEKPYAETVKRFLLGHDLLRFGVSPLHSYSHVFFPLSSKPSPKILVQLKKLCHPCKILTRSFSSPAQVTRGNLKDVLQSKLSPEELSHLISSHDIIGSIAVLQIPDELLHRKKLIAQTVLDMNHSLQTACMITAPHFGKYRTQKIKILAGKKSTETLYREHGCQFKLDIARVFFSPRLSFERARINSLIQPKEVIAALFSGVGPFAILFAKNSNTRKVYSIELNPIAVKYHKINNELNHVQEKIELLKGDVRKIVPLKLKHVCDRIVMPLPETGELFLKEAFMALKPRGGIIHFYHFAPRDDPFAESIARFKEIAKKFNCKIRVQRKAICRTFSAKIVQIVLDVKVFK